MEFKDFKNDVERTRMKLRFATSKGNLSVEDLQDLTLPSLDTIAVALDEELSKSPKKSFIQEVNPENEILQIKLNIVCDIITDKMTEKNEREQAKNKQAEKSRLLGILARKQEESLETLTEEELKKRIAELG